MKRFLIIIPALLLCCLLSAQDYMVPELEAALREDLKRSTGNMMPYNHGDLTETPAPCGYKPFYISHYARHGSRHSWGDKYYQRVIEVCRKADSLGILNDKGRAVWQEAVTALETWNGMDGRLSPLGVEEHRQMAHRMAKRYRAVFRGEPHIRVRFSTVQRSILSGTSFSTALAADFPRAKWDFDTGERIMDYIGDTGKSAPEVDALRSRVRNRKWDFQVDKYQIVGRLFTDSLAALTIIPDIAKFNSGLFQTASVAACWEFEDHILTELPFGLIYRYCSDSNHRGYARYGNPVEVPAERLASAHLLVDDIVSKADEVIANGGYAADLRFGHDNPLEVLISYIGIEGPGGKYSFDELDKYYARWRDICMGSNLQMIFYRNKAGHVLVKFLYQEQERRLRGLESVTGPYYDWETVKANIEGFRR